MCYVRKYLLYTLNISVDCFLNLESGKASIGVVTAEEAFLAAPLTSNIVVIGEKHTGTLFVQYLGIIVVKDNYSIKRYTYTDRGHC